MQQVHGALSHFFSHRDDGATDFALCPPEDGPEGSTRIEVRLLSDRREVVDRLIDGLDAANGRGGLFLGERDRQRKVRLLPPTGAVSMGALSLMEAVSWSELRTGAGSVSAFRMSFQSPTFFRRGSRQMVFPLPSSVLNSLRRQWVAHAPQLVPHELSDTSELLATQFSGQTVTVVLDRARWTGFVGEVDYVLGGRSVADERVVGCLLSAARFTGVGSMVAYGFGVVDVTG
jgi:hypothetical protein